MPKDLIRRSELVGIEARLRTHPIVAVLGARQVGKTTLARQILGGRRGETHFFDAERAEDAATLSQPELALARLRGLVVIDEAQRVPGVFPALRVLADRPRHPARFLLLGSASPDLVGRSSETLAGRIDFHELSGFSLEEVGIDHLDRLWLRGGFPRSYLARNDRESSAWRRGFVRTFLERDIPQLGVRVPAATLRRAWGMLAHYHGQVWNASEIARSFGVAHTTVRRWVDLLEGTFMIRQLLPWSANLKKRQVRAPKIYFTDSGLLHQLLGVRTRRELEAHPKLGASWEGFALDCVARHLRAEREECYFWATYSGAELDLLVTRGNRRLGFEFKRTLAPSVTPSMRVALEDLDLERLDVIHAGERTFQLAPRIRAVALSRIFEDVRPLR
ncbi:MAG: ATP-binding protein [Planctomycetes bacterium]|nr:ATP-binding protein [Planctomycetota bacterium]